MEVSTISNDPIATSAIANIDRICGRKFTTITTEDAQKTICSKRGGMCNSDSTDSTLTGQVM